MPPEHATPTGEPVDATVRAAEAAVHAAEVALDQAAGAREEARDELEAVVTQLGQQLERLRAAQEAERFSGQRRDTLLARRDDIKQRQARLSARLIEVTGALDDRMRRRGELELAALDSALEAAERELRAAETMLETARAQASEAETVSAEAQRIEQRARGALQRLEAEAGALAELAAPGSDGTCVIDLIEVADGAAQALAAALGDDLLGSLETTAPSHWREAPAAAAAPADLPPGCRPLAAMVDAPAALSRRLAQVGVVEAADADRLLGQLRQGQRLVSPDGGLWRWDGFVRLPNSGRSAAARLQQRSQLVELQRDAVAAQSRLHDAERALAGATVAADAARQAQREADAGCVAERRALETARQAALEARAQDAAVAVELAALAQERAAIETEQSELGSAAAALMAQLDAIGMAGPEGAPAGLRDAVREAEARREQSAGRDREAKEAHDEAHRALSAAREWLVQARAELERRREAERELAAWAREQELQRVQLEAQRARLTDQRAELDRDATVAQSEAQATEDELGAARARLGAAEETVAGARRDHGAAVMEHARARDALAAAALRAGTLAEELELWAQRAQSSEARLAELARRRAELSRELSAMTSAPVALERQRAELEEQLAGVERERRQLSGTLTIAEAALAEAQAQLDGAETDRVESRESGARLEARLERAQAECAQAEDALRARLGHLPSTGEAEPAGTERLAELEAELARLGLARERLGPVNLRAIDEAAELSLRIQDLEAEQAELAGAIERLRRAIGTLNREGRERLRAAFAKVEEHFEALFVRLFGGGRARLSLTDLEDPLAAGLELAASPPGKKLQSLSLLSGGEKALTALALIFAVFLTRPAPLCVLDEVDAPLDDANVERLIALLDELSRATDTRFLVVTHHPLTMARMHRLYGVTMAERGLSQLVSVDLESAVELRATA